jgi:tetratricopeptide (TPR) repeat protein
VFVLNAYARDSIQVIWEKANAFYATEEYQKAVIEYEQILDAGQESAKLYFNLGNAYYKAGDYNNAILNYERAKLLAPQDEDIEFNLRMANQFVVTGIEALPQPFFVRWKNSIINRYPADSWAAISAGLFMVFLLLLGAFLFSRSASVKKLSFWFGILAILLTAFTFSFAARQKEKIDNRNHAIIFCPRVTVKSAPSENSTDLFLLYEGVKVEISDSLDSWKEIRLSDGNLGWLPDSCIVKI